MKDFEVLFDSDGNFKTDSSYTEIIKLHKMLERENIPHDFHGIMDGYQVVYPGGGNRVSDAVEHFGSYGHENDLLEIMGLLTDEEKKFDSVCGDLTAENVFNRYKKHYEENKGEG